MQNPTLGKCAFAFATLVSATFATNVAAQPFCEDTIVADTTLSGDLLCPGLGLGIGASGVTLDCDGHTIEAGGTFFGRVVEVNSGLSDVTVMNCVMIGNASTDALRVNGGTTNILITGNDITTSGSVGAHAVRLLGTSSSEISNNTVSTSGLNAQGFRIEASPDNLFADNTVSTSGSLSRGFRLQAGSNNNVLSGNVVHTTGDGATGVLLRPVADDNLVERNVLRTDNTEPVRIESSSGNVFDGNTLVSATGWLTSRRFLLQNGGLSVHPDGRIFAVDNIFGGGELGTVTALFEVEATTGRAMNVTRLTLGGFDLGFGFDALEITPDERFLALRGAGAGELYEIDPDTGVVTFLFGAPTLPDVNGLESNGINSLLATTNGGGLLSIDLVPPGSALIGFSGVVGWTDIAVDPTTSRAYAVSRFRNEASVTSHLYEIDVTTGSIVQEIGDIGLSFVSDMDFAPDGTLYGNDASLLMIDPATAATESVGAFGEDPFEPPSEDNILSKTTLVAVGGSGSVHYPGTLAVPSGELTTVSTAELEISFNRVFLDSAIHPFLDQEAIITLLGLPGKLRRLLVDEDDDGEFEMCRQSRCKPQLFAGGTLVFEVDDITTYSSEVKGL